MNWTDITIGLFTIQSNLLFWGWAFIYLFAITLLFLFKIYRQSRQGHKHVSLFSFLFPKTIYRSQSFFDDLKILTVYILVTIFLTGYRASLQLAIAAGVSSLLKNNLISLIGPQTWPQGLSIYILILPLALATDLGSYWGHRLMHQIPWMWHFHKVHHSANYLAPTTQFRSHPVEPVFKEIFLGLFPGLLMGFVLCFNIGDQLPAVYSSLWVGNILYYLSFHFRHSHFWISYGPHLSYFFNSPAMHHIHHSIEDRHRNKNFGVVFSVWDWMFGTIYIPRKKENFRIGLEDPKEQQLFTGIRNHYTIPFKLVMADIKRKFF